MSTKPSIPKGTRDFSPVEVAKRTYIMNTIRSNFQRFGFQPIETPSFENSDTLMGKYGEEGDRLIFKILDSGQFYEKKIENKIENSISIFVAVTYIFKDLVFEILNDINEKGLEFATKDDLEKYSSDSEFQNLLDNKIGEWGNFLIKDYKTFIKFHSLFTAKTKSFFDLIVDFIFSKGLDFNRKREDERFLSWQLKWADRHILKDYVKETFSGFIKQESDYLSEVNSVQVGAQISEKALRYDLTVPFARYVVHHQNDIVFPFKRFQIQPVWRADRPQKGRFREFYQCDADVVGSASLWQEVEFVQLYDAVFTALKLEGVTIKMNNRKILSGIAEVIGASDKLIDFTVALDKLDKIGADGVTKEMLEKGITQEAIDTVSPLFTLSGSFGDQLDTLKNLLASSETGTEGIEELLFINNEITNLGLETATLQLDVTLARGLNYYTGAIFEVAAPEGVKMGSIGGGGRYADLTGIFGLKDMSGVGISFGLDRIYLVLEELNLFPEETTEGVKAFFVNFGNEEAAYAMQAITSLRKNGISSELYPDPVTSNKQMKKQMTYANRRNIPFLILAGKEEMDAGTFTLKNMAEGSQETVTLDQLQEILAK